MIRLLAALVLVGASVQAETTYSEVVGYTGNLFFYKNQNSQENQILNVSSPNSFQARYGYWDFTAQLFIPTKSFYPPEFESDPEQISVTFSSGGEATLAGLVHPYIPLPGLPNGYGGRHYSPPGPGQGLGIEFSYMETSFMFSSIIVLNSQDNDWISGNDQAVLGQIQNQNGGTVITMVPEPTSLSLLFAGGAVLMAGRRRKSD